MHFTRKAGLGLALLTVGGFVALPAQAQLTFVTSQPALNGNDSIDWQSYGYAVNAFPDSTNLLTTNGIGFNVTDPFVANAFDPRGPFFPEPTDFTPAEIAQALRIAASSPSAEISINFLTPVSAVGALLENRNANNNIGPTFTGYVSAYNGTTLLGSFSETHTIQNLQDGSAPFLGVVSDTADITSVVYHVTDFNEFFIGPVSLKGTPAAVPEASTTVSLGLLLALGLGGVVIAAKRKKASAPSA